MLDLAELSTQELSAIVRQAGRECVRRYAAIAAASDPSDRALHDLLLSMAADAHRQAGGMQFPVEDGAFGSGGRLSPEGVRELIDGSFSSLSKGFGEGTLHRDIALFYAESLEEEASRFYRMLAEHARESKARSTFSELSEIERGRLRFLREVVLQS